MPDFKLKVWAKMLVSTFLEAFVQQVYGKVRLLRFGMCTSSHILIISCFVHSNGTHNSEDTAPRIPFFTGQKCTRRESQPEPADTPQASTSKAGRPETSSIEDMDKRVCNKLIIS